MDKNMRAALAWANSACAMAATNAKRGNFDLLERFPPPLKQYYAQCYSQRRIDDAIFASLWPHDTGEIMRIHANYVALEEAESDIDQTDPAPDLTGPLEISADGGFSESVKRPEDLRLWEADRNTLNAFMRQMGDLSRLSFEELDALVNELTEFLKRDQVQRYKNAAAKFTPAEVEKMIGQMQKEIDRRKNQSEVVTNG